MKIGDRTCFGDNFSSPLNLIQARCRSGGGLSSAVHRAAFASARTLPPPRRSGLRIHPSLRSDLICSARRPRSRLGNPARLRRSGGRRRFALSAAREPRCAPLETRSARAFVRSAYARLHPRPGNGGDAVPANPSAASRCSPALATLSVCLEKCRTDSGGAAAPQNFPAASFGVNRLPSSFASLGRGLYYGRYPHYRLPPAKYSPRITPRFLPAIATARGSSHRLTSVLHFVRTWICYVRWLHYRLPPGKHSPSPFGSCRGSAAPQNIPANTLAHPIIGTLCKVAAFASTLRYRYAYGYITQTIIRRAS